VIEFSYIELDNDAFNYSILGELNIEIEGLWVEEKEWL
jgi:hypothetical protein